MSRLGVWQCTKLTLSLCKWGGSSRGARAFQESLGPQFQEANPQLEYLVQQRPSRHPFLEAKYRNGRDRVVDIKNIDEEQILRFAYLLRSAAGRKTSLPLRRETPALVRAQGGGVTFFASTSVQGRWRPGMFPPVHETL